MDRPERADADGDGTPAPITSLADPRAIQILSTEHWSLLSARSLAYNEAFTRGGMFLTFLSMAFVGLALLADAMGFSPDFLAVAAVVLGFAFVVGLTSYIRVSGANFDDLRAMHAIARIRHAYVEAAPMLADYFRTATSDDVARVLADYGAPATNGLAMVGYGLSTSLGMLGLILSMLGGVELAVLAMLIGTSTFAAAVIGVIGGAVILVALIVTTVRRAAANQALLDVRFPLSAEDQDPHAH